MIPRSAFCSVFVLPNGRVAHSLNMTHPLQQGGGLYFVSWAPPWGGGTVTMTPAAVVGP